MSLSRAPSKIESSMIAQNNGIFMLFKKVIVGPSEKNNIWGSKMAKCDFWPNFGPSRLRQGGSWWNFWNLEFFLRIISGKRIWELDQAERDVPKKKVLLVLPTLNRASKHITSIEFMVYMTNQHIWEYEKVWLIYHFRVPRAIFGLSWARNNSFWPKMMVKSLKDPQ